MRARVFLILILVIIISVSFTDTLNAEARGEDFSIYAGTGFLPAGENSTFGWMGGLEYSVNPGVSMLGDAAFYSQEVDVTEYYSAKVDLSIFRASGGYEVVNWGDRLPSITVYTGLGVYRVTALNNTENELGFHVGTNIKQKIMDNFKLRAGLSYAHGVETELLDEGLIEISGAVTFDF